MSEYVNTANINVADMVYVDFGCLLNNNTTVISKLAMTPDTLRAIRDTATKILEDLEAKQVAMRKAN